MSEWLQGHAWWVASHSIIHPPGSAPDVRMYWILKNSLNNEKWIFSFKRIDISANHGQLQMIKSDSKAQVKKLARILLILHQILAQILHQSCQFLHLRK